MIILNSIVILLGIPLSIIGLLIVVVSFAGLIIPSIRQQLNVDGTSTWGIFGMFLLGVLLLGAFILLFSFCINRIMFEKKKTIIYEKPIIKQSGLVGNNVYYEIDDELHEYSDIKWLNSNNIYYKIEYYKDTTNKELVVKNG
jgi:hypothetical protein